MNLKEDKVLLSHGNGGRIMHSLITGLFVKHFGNRILNRQNDSAILPVDGSEIAFTTDSFVIDPVFFPGGDIGKLAVCGSVNDLSVAGAEPLFISVSFIIEEGFPMKDLETIVISLASEAKKAGVLIVTGDTKVVNKGKCDKIFINTSGIGRLSSGTKMEGRNHSIRPGDVILINGGIAEHGMAVMNAREDFRFKTTVESDCASLNRLIGDVLSNTVSVKFMRDPTRGGVATVLNELCGKMPFGIQLDEVALPVNKGVRAICEILGFDPLYVANEGKVVMVTSEKESRKVLSIMKKHKTGRQSAVIGKIVKDHPGKVVLRTETGGKRIIDSLSGDPLPRIC